MIKTQDYVNAIAPCNEITGEIQISNSNTDSYFRGISFDFSKYDLGETHPVPQLRNTEDGTDPFYTVDVPCFSFFCNGEPWELDDDGFFVDMNVGGEGTQEHPWRNLTHAIRQASCIANACRSEVCYTSVNKCILIHCKGSYNYPIYVQRGYVKFTCNSYDNKCYKVLSDYEGTPFTEAIPVFIVPWGDNAVRIEIDTKLYAHSMEDPNKLEYAIGFTDYPINFYKCDIIFKAYSGTITPLFKLDKPWCIINSLVDCTFIYEYDNNFDEYQQSSEIYVSSHNDIVPPVVKNCRFNSLVRNMPVGKTLAVGLNTSYISDCSFSGAFYIDIHGCYVGNVLCNAINHNYTNTIEDFKTLYLYNLVDVDSSYKSKINSDSWTSHMRVNNAFVHNIHGFYWIEADANYAVVDFVDAITVRVQAANGGSVYDITCEELDVENIDYVHDINGKIKKDRAQTTTPMLDIYNAKKVFNIKTDPIYKSQYLDYIYAYHVEIEGCAEVYDITTGVLSLSDCADVTNVHDTFSEDETTDSYGDRASNGIINSKVNGCTFHRYTTTRGSELVGCTFLQGITTASSLAGCAVFGDYYGDQNSSITDSTIQASSIYAQLFISNANNCEIRKTRSVGSIDCTLHKNITNCSFYIQLSTYLARCGDMWMLNDPLNVSAIELTPSDAVSCSNNSIHFVVDFVNAEEFDCPYIAVDFNITTPGGENSKACADAFSSVIVEHTELTPAIDLGEAYYFRQGHCYRQYFGDFLYKCDSLVYYYHGGDEPYWETTTCCK